MITCHSDEDVFMGRRLPRTTWYRFSELCYRSQRDIQPLTGFSCTISVCVCFRRFLADTILVLNAGFLWSIGVFDLDL